MFLQRMKKMFLASVKAVVSFIFFFILSVLPAQNVQVYGYTGFLQTFVVPPCITTMTMEAWGAQGGMDANTGYNSNFGGYASAVFNVVPGTVLNIYVGSQATSTLGGFNGGGDGYINPGYPGIGRGGGGASDVRIGGTGLLNRVLVAGGGGGGGSDIYGNWVIGGAGGGLAGTQGVNYDGGCAGAQPGTQVGSGPGICNGVSNTNMNGTFGYGGNALPLCGYGFGCGGGASSGNAGYGGGGGWWGGSAGSANFGGGGGSGYILPAATNGVFATNVNAGNGQVRLTYAGSVLTLTATSTACSPTGSASVVASGGTAPFTYTWSGTAQTTSLVTGLAAGIYTVRVADAGNCASGTSTVAVTRASTITANSATICPGRTATLVASATASYTWSPGATLNAANAATVLANPAGTTIYTLTTTNSLSCLSTNTVQVVVNPTPTTTVNSATICSGQTATLVANSASSYTWAPGTTLAAAGPGTVWATPTITTIYTVTTSNSLSCTSSATAQVLVNTTPTVAASTSTICVGNSATITVAPMVSYTWTPAGSLSAVSGQSVVANPLSTTVYTASFTNSLACTGSNTFQVLVTSTATMAIPNSTNCAGQTLSLSSNGATGTYSWTGPLGFTSAQPNPTIALSTTGMSGAYNFSVVSAAGCTNQAVANVTVFPLPSPTITSNSPICNNNNLVLSAGGNATTYTWTGPAPNNFSSVAQNTNIAVATTLDSGTYTLVASYTTGCSSTVTRSLTVTALPVPTLAYNNPVCMNAMLALAGTGGSSYAWTGPNAFTSAVQNPSISNVQLAASGIYTLVATLNSCTASVTQSITIHPLPAPTATNNSPVCENSLLQLGAAAGATYTWSGPAAFSSTLQTPSIPTASLVNSGIYTVTVTDANTCMASAFTTVTILPKPAIVATGTTVCLNEPGTLTVTGGTAWSWTGPAGFASALPMPTVAVVDNLTAGIYSVIVSAANTCTAGAAVTLSFIALPVLVPTVTAVCFNAAATLSVGGAATYTWTGPSSYQATGSLVTVPAANALSSGVYTIIGTAGNTCTNSAIATLTTMPLPVVTATGGIVCLKEAAVLASSGSTDVVTYAWSGAAGFTTGAQNATITSATSAAPVNYTVTATAINGCTSQAVVTLSTHALPLVSATSTVICKNQPFTIAAAGAVTYVWNGPAGSSSGSTLLIPNVNAGSVGMYTVIGTDVNTCSNVATAKLDTLPLPQVSAIGSTVCIGSPATLKASGAVSYFWSGPGGYTSGTSAALISSAASAATQVYSVVGTAPNTCTQIAYAFLDTYPLPQPTYTAPSRVCFKSNIQLQGAGASTYTWSGPFNYYSVNKDVLIPVYKNAQQGTYTLNVMDHNGCVNYTTVTVMIDPLPAGNLVSNNKSNYCLPYCSEFKLQSTGVPPITAYNWVAASKTFTSAAFESCLSKTSGNVVIGTFTNAAGCVNTISFAVEVAPSPVADYVYTPDKPVENMDLVEFRDHSTGEKLVKWDWYFADNKNFSGTGKTTSYTFENAGSFPVALVVTNDWGCADTVIKTIFVDSDYKLFVPNAFTPDGDGLNDTFQPKGRGLAKYTLSIYDRWGNRVFQTSDFDTGWDGQVYGKNSSDDTYIWKINGVDVKGRVKELSGYVTLIK